MRNNAADMHAKRFLQRRRKRPVNTGQIFLLETAKRQLLDGEVCTWANCPALYALGRGDRYSGVVQSRLGRTEGIATDPGVDQKQLFRTLVHAPAGDEKMVTDKPERNFRDCTADSPRRVVRLQDHPVVHVIKSKTEVREEFRSDYTGKPLPARQRHQSPGVEQHRRNIIHFDAREDELCDTPEHRSRPGTGTSGGRSHRYVRVPCELGIDNEFGRTGIEEE